MPLFMQYFEAKNKLRKRRPVRGTPADKPNTGSNFGKFVKFFGRKKLEGKEKQEEEEIEKEGGGGKTGEEEVEEVIKEEKRGEGEEEGEKKKKEDEATMGMVLRAIRDLDGRLGRMEAAAEQAAKVGEENSKALKELAKRVKDIGTQQEEVHEAVIDVMTGLQALLEPMTGPGEAQEPPAPPSVAQESNAREQAWVRSRLNRIRAWNCSWSTICSGEYDLPAPFHDRETDGNLGRRLECELTDDAFSHYQYNK